MNAVLGARVHSGWAALVAVSGDPRDVQVIDRRRVVFTDPAVPGAQQPYHYVESMKLPDAEKHLAKCAAVSARLASAAIREMLQELRLRAFEVAGAAILLAAGRPLPGLSAILASHALIHTAEGEFFRASVRHAWEEQGISVTAIRERDLDQRAADTFGPASAGFVQRIAALGRALGPPWTRDQKSATLAASIVLANLCGQTYSKDP